MATKAELEAQMAQLQAQLASVGAISKDAVQAAPVKKLTAEEELAYLREENAKLMARQTATNSGKVTWKRGAKGGIQIMGLGRYPYTPYLSQWDSLYANMEGINDWVTEKRKVPGFFTTKPVNE
jgi:hypothetical protein